MKTIKQLALAALIAVLPLSAQAHRAWLLPAATVLSAEDSWVTVDAAVSNDIFHMDWAPLRLDNLQVVAPDGTRIAPQNPHTGKYRSSFDLELSQRGTYRIAIVNSGLLALYELDGERKRWRGTADEFKQAIPKTAKILEVSQSAGRIETFITAGSPSGDALESTGVGFELMPETHPNDLFQGEAATFALLLDGEPAADQEITVIPGGMRYRTSQDEITVKTDAAGKFSITWPNAGMYWLETSLQDEKTDIAAAKRRRVLYVATLEVLPQ